MKNRPATQVGRRIIMWVTGAVVLSATPAAAQLPGALPSLTTSPWRDTDRSLQIAELRTQVAGGDLDTERFWKAIRAQGTPLIEPAAASDQHQLITFLWRGDETTRNVLVVWDPFTWVRPQDYLMQHLERTNVWYLTVRVPRRARFIYRLAINLSPNPSFFGDLPLVPPPQADPLNPRRWLGQSPVELSDAPPYPWSEPTDVPRGTVVRAEVDSDLLKNRRAIHVYTPAGYSADTRPLPLILLFDGEANLERIPAPTILDNLIAARRIPASIAVFVANPGQSRTQELLHNPRFADFLASELVPWLRARYRITADPQLTVVGGVSAGGTAALSAALRHSEAFGKVLSQSGDFFSSRELLRNMEERIAAAGAAGDRHSRAELEDRAMIEGNDLQRQVIAADKLPVTVYLNAGVFEAEFWGGPAGTAGILESNRHMRDVLRAKGYTVHYEEFVGGHDYLSWRGLLGQGLIALLGSRAD